MSFGTVLTKIDSLIDLIDSLKVGYSNSQLFYQSNNKKLTIRGLIFDFGSVLSYSTQKFVKKLMQKSICETTQKIFNLTNNQTAEFLSIFLSLKTQFKQRKLFLGTGTCLDEGFILEYTLKQVIYDTLSSINIDTSNIPSSDIELMMKSYRDPGIQHAKMIEGVHEFLEWCSINNIRCAIASNYWDPPRTKQLLAKFGIFKYFRPIIISGESSYRKPDYRMLKPILNEWNDLQLSEIVFIGDDPRRDILLAHYVNIRSILAKFYNRLDAKYQKKGIFPSSKKANEQLKNNSYVNLGRDVAIQCVSDEIGYTTSDVTVTDYKQIPNALYEISCKEYKQKPLIVGLYILPQKITKLTKRNVFNMVHRKDIIFKTINMKESIHSQGPFDILIHKIASWYVAAEYDIDARNQLHNFLAFINSCKTNLNSKLKTYDNKLLTNDHDYKDNDNDDDEHVMYVLDNPECAKRTCDRVDMYTLIDDINININNLSFKSPEYILLTSNELNLLKDLHVNSDKGKELLNKISSKLTFPIIAKQRIAVSPVTNASNVNKDIMKNIKSCAHSMYIIPDMRMIYAALSSYTSSVSCDWILQNYINHSGCHKVYVVGDDVFITVNDSTPNTNNINLQNYTFIDSGKYSKKQLKDQKDKKYDNVYKKLSKILRKSFGLTCFGYDLIFDLDNNNGYIVDCNFLPGYKSVDNFSAVFWGFVLKEYHKFVKIK